MPNAIVITVLVIIVIIVAVWLLMHRARRSSATACIDIDAPRDMVWNVITDYPSEPKWLPHVDAVDIITEDARVEHHNDDVSVELKVLHRKPSTALVWTYIVHEPVHQQALLKGDWHIDLRDKPEGVTEVCIRQRERDTRMLVTLLKSLRGRRTDLQVYLSCLRHRCEDPEHEPAVEQSDR